MENCESAQHIAKFSGETVLVKLPIKCLMAEAKVIIGAHIPKPFFLFYSSLLKYLTPSHVLCALHKILNVSCLNL